MKGELAVSTVLLPLPLGVLLLLGPSRVTAVAQETGGPPDATLTARSGTQRADPLFFCWPQPEGPGLCVDGDIRGRPASGLPVIRGELVRFQIAISEEPESLVLDVLPEERRFDLSPSTVAEWRVTVPPGRYHAFLGASWEDKDSSWLFSIEVTGLAETGAGVPGHPVLWLALSAIGLLGAMALLRRPRAAR